MDIVSTELNKLKLSSMPFLNDTINATIAQAIKAALIEEIKEMMLSQEENQQGYEYIQYYNQALTDLQERLK